MGSVWVFSPRSDLIAFYLPLLIALALVPLVPEASAGQGQVTAGFLLYNLTVAMMIDHGHVYGTIIPVYFDRWRRRKLSWRAAVVPASVLVVGLILASFSNLWFSTILAYLAIWHICRQHYGWLVSLERKELADGQGRWRKLDRLFFFATLLVPIYCWQSDLSSVKRRYFSDNDMAFALNADYWPVLHGVYAALVFAFLFSALWLVRKEGERSLGKILFLLATFFWFYGGLVVASNAIFFWVTLTICHGVSYHIHINRYWTSSFGGEPPGWFRINRAWKTGAYLVIVTAISVFILTTRRRWLGEGEGWRIALVNFFLISHYVFDAFIWRKGFRGQPAIA